MREILDYLPASAHEATKARVRQGGYTMHDCVICSAIQEGIRCRVEVRAIDIR